MPADRVVLDTSALLTFTDGEPGAETVEKLLRRAARRQLDIFVSFASFTECFYTRWRSFGEEEALKLILHLKQLPMKRVDSDEEMSLLAGEIKARHSLSFADAWIASLAKTKGAPLVHKDPEFEQLYDEIELVNLPYK